MMSVTTDDVMYFHLYNLVKDLWETLTIRKRVNYEEMCAEIWEEKFEPTPSPQKKIILEPNHTNADER